MHPRVIAQKTAAAQARTLAAAQVLAERHGLDGDLAAALNVYERDPETRLVRRYEAVADLLDALVKAVPVKKAAKAAAVPIPNSSRTRGRSSADEGPSPVGVAEEAAHRCC